MGRVADLTKFRTKGVKDEDQTDEQPDRVGPGRLTEKGFRLEMSVKPGDIVLVGKYAGSEVKIDSDEFLIVTDDDVLGILDNTA